MTEERVTTTGTEPHTTIIERRGGGGGWAIAIVLLIAVTVGGFYLFGRQGAQNGKDAAITSAAKSVGGAADKVGDAVASPKGDRHGRAAVSPGPIRSAVAYRRSSAGVTRRGVWPA